MSDIKMSELEVKVMSDDLIEVGIDPSFDNDYQDSYSASFTTSDLKFMLSKLGVDCDSQAETIAKQAEEIELRLTNNTALIACCKRRDEKKAKLEMQLTMVRDANERLQATLEDRSLKADSPASAADCYYEIAEILKVQEGHSVTDRATELMKKIKQLESN